MHVHAADPITRAGAEAQLRQCPELEIAEEGAAPAPGAVAVVLVETADATALASLRRLVRGGEQRVVLVVERMREAELLDAVECGVAAILWRREATAVRLGRAVLAAARGDGDLPADLLGRLIAQVGRLQRSVQGLPGYVPPGLSERESDVLRLVAEGWDTGEIAAQLSYSERTVKNVLHGLTTRLQLRNRAHAVAHALREGYI
ncbi:helix-turn-helix transcriptional regulator [Kitasatospora sp. NPDC054939]